MPSWAELTVALHVALVSACVYYIHQDLGKLQVHAQVTLALNLALVYSCVYHMHQELSKIQLHLYRIAPLPDVLRNVDHRLVKLLEVAEKYHRAHDPARRTS